MSVDTSGKRFSMMNMGRQPIWPLFIPGGSVDAANRAHLLNLYSGIPLSGSSPPVFNGAFSSVAASSTGYLGALRVNASFSPASATSLTVSGSIVHQGNLSSGTSTALSAIGLLSLNSSFSSVSSTDLSALSSVILHGIFDSTIISTLNIFSEEPPAQAKRVIAASAVNRIITPCQNTRIIYTH